MPHHMDRTGKQQGRAGQGKPWKNVTSIFLCGFHGKEQGGVSRFRIGCFGAPGHRGVPSHLVLGPGRLEQTDSGLECGTPMKEGFGKPVLGWLVCI